MTYEDLIHAIGPGFHPDCDGSDYNDLPKGMSIQRYDRIVEEAHRNGDAYERAFLAFVRFGWIKSPSEVCTDHR